MKQKNTVIFLALAIIGALLFSLLTIYASAEGTRALKKQIDVSAHAATLYEPTTQQFLFTKNADVRLPMASTTKIMTAIVALENADLDDLVTIDERAVGIEGSSAYLKIGDTLSIEELVYALMLQSANDAAEAIAYHISGSVDAFAELMNEKALSLGLENTNFENPHGLDSENHYTTAHDLSIIAACALENSLLRTVSSTYKKTFKTESRQRTYVNHNKLLLRTDGAIGLKTGFTKKSGRCLVGAAQRDGLTLISVTLDAPNDWNDHAVMLDYGFSSIEAVTLIKKDELYYDIPVINGRSSTLRVECESDVELVMPKQDREIKIYAKLPSILIAPIHDGDALGAVYATVNGETVAQARLIATKDVYTKPKNRFLSNIFKRLTNKEN